MEALTLAAVTAIIPALNEAASIGPIVASLLDRGIGRVVVADGGSVDATAALAREAGATVVVQRERGYGSACLAGIAEADGASVLLFLDGDGAEDLDSAVRVAETLLRGDAGIVLGKRVVEPGEAGAQTLLARGGNALCAWWLRVAFGATISDFASMKAVRRETYEQLHPEQRRYGWTAQLIARAARERVAMIEISVPYRRRSGRSKVSGTLKGALAAGRQMLAVIAVEQYRFLLDCAPAMRRLHCPPRPAGRAQPGGGG
jgi:glycosyltransferase involved in cell wall biosynthesis